MAKCPNCGQETTGDYCQWCKYPMVEDVPEERPKAEKRAKEEADVAPHPPIVIDPRQQAKEVEECLEEVESICKELKAGKVKTREALERLSDIL